MQITQREHAKSFFFSQNNKIILLSNMADIFFEEFTRCAKVCGLLFLDSGFLLLIGLAKTPAKP